MACDEDKKLRNADIANTQLGIADGTYAPTARRINIVGVVGDNDIEFEAIDKAGKDISGRVTWGDLTMAWPFCPSLIPFSGHEGKPTASLTKGTRPAVGSGGNLYVTQAFDTKFNLLSWPYKFPPNLAARNEGNSERRMELLMDEIRTLREHTMQLFAEITIEVESLELSGRAVADSSVGKPGKCELRDENQVDSIDLSSSPFVLKLSGAALRSFESPEAADQGATDARIQPSRLVLRGCVRGYGIASIDLLDGQLADNQQVVRLNRKDKPTCTVRLTPAAFFRLGSVFPTEGSFRT
jgi:hypothetical protein